MQPQAVQSTVVAGQRNYVNSVRFSPSVFHRTGTASSAPLRDVTTHAVSASSVLGYMPSSTASRSVVNALDTDAPPVLSREPSTESNLGQSLPPGQQVVDRYFKPSRPQQQDSGLADMAAALSRMQAQLDRLAQPTSTSGSLPSPSLQGPLSEREVGVADPLVDADTLSVNSEASSADLLLMPRAKAVMAVRQQLGFPDPEVQEEQPRSTLALIVQSPDRDQRQVIRRCREASKALPLAQSVSMALAQRNADLCGTSNLTLKLQQPAEFTLQSEIGPDAVSFFTSKKPSTVLRPQDCLTEESALLSFSHLQLDPGLQDVQKSLSAVQRQNFTAARELELLAKRLLQVQSSNDLFVSAYVSAIQQRDQSLATDLHALYGSQMALQQQSSADLATRILANAVQRQRDIILNAPVSVQPVKDKGLQSSLRACPIHGRYLFAGCYKEALKQQREISQKPALKQPLQMSSAGRVQFRKRKAPKPQKSAPAKRQKPVVVTRTVTVPPPQKTTFRGGKAGRKP